MRNQRTALRIGAVVMLSLLAAGSVLAAGLPGRLPQPRITEPGFHALAPRPGLMPLGIGKPNSIALLDSWVTSDLVPDDYTTFPFWYDSESISIYLAFYNAKEQSVKITLDIRDLSGHVVFTGQDEEVWDADTVIGGSIPVGNFAVGQYKVTVKMKVGSKVLGQQYWMFVYPDPGT